jgi:hypothetical protein
LAGHRKIWVASGRTFTLPAQLTFVAALNTIISRSPGETTKILHERPWIAVYGYGCIVRVGTDTQIADLLVEKGAHPLETCAPCHFCDPWPKLLKDQHEWGTILSLTLAHYRAFRPLPRPKPRVVRSEVKGPIRCHKCQLNRDDASEYLGHKCEPKPQRQ